MDKNVAKISRFIKKYDTQLYGHCVRTALRAKRLSELLNVDSDLIYQAALIHDLGKIGISKSIFDKPEKLTKNDRRAVDLHSFIGYSMAYNMGVPKNICILILYHHGYNKERFGECSCIPEDYKLLVDIIRISDIYDALTSERIYKKSVSHREAINMLFEHSELDNDLINKFDVLYMMNSKAI